MRRLSRSLRSWIKRLERSGPGRVRILQRDGPAFEQSARTADVELYVYLYQGALAGMPPDEDIPEIVRALANAKDRADRVRGYLLPHYSDMLWFDAEHFISTGEIVPLGGNSAEDLSEGVRY